MIARCIDCGAPFSRGYAERWKVRCVDCWRDLRAASERAPLLPPPPIDALRLRQLLQLCHPDRHGGSALATEVTCWLLEQRRRVA